MKTNLIINIINLRLSVSFLSEKNRWLNSKFYENSSDVFLSHIFPKSKNAQFLSSNIATQNFVDEQVGANYYHLFRLTILMEELIFNTIKNTAIKELKSEENALKTLTELSLNNSTDGKSGPKYIGSIDEINKLINVFAAEYLNAFKNDYIVHPYLNG